MRTKRATLTAFFSAVSLIIQSIFSLAYTRTVLTTLGSDYNGISSTIAQYMSVLLLIESGFTLAVLVKLYKPYAEKNVEEINMILSKAQKDFKRIGLSILFVGMISSSVYSLFIKTSIDYITILALFSFSIFSTFFNFYFIYKYRILFQVAQKEYWIFILNTIISIFSYGGMQWLVYNTQNIIFANVYQLICTILSGGILHRLFYNQFPSARYDINCESIQIEGTKDLFITRLLGLIYNSFTVFYIASFEGALMVSVYTVYNSIVSLIGNFLQSVLSAPQNALGEIYVIDKKYFQKIFMEFEFVGVTLSCVFFSTTAILLMPFVELYTSGVNDIAYYNLTLGNLLIITAVLQMIHIPCGKCIELTGRFNIAKNIQLVGLIALILFSIMGAIRMGFLGLVYAKLLTNIIFAVLEIGYVHWIIIKKSEFRSIMFMYITNIFLGLCVTIFGRLFVSPNIKSFIGFIVWGSFSLAIDILIFFLCGIIFYKPYYISIITRFKLFWKKIGGINEEK